MVDKNVLLSSILSICTYTIIEMFVPVKKSTKVPILNWTMNFKKLKLFSLFPEARVWKMVKYSNNKRHTFIHGFFHARFRTIHAIYVTGLWSNSSKRFGRIADNGDIFSRFHYGRWKIERRPSKTLPSIINRCDNDRKNSEYLLSWSPFAWNV